MASDGSDADGIEDDGLVADARTGGLDAGEVTSSYGGLPMYDAERPGAEPGRVVKHALLSPPSPPKLAKKLRQVRSHRTTEHRFRCTAVDHRTFLSWVYHISQGLLFDRIDAVEHNLLILKALSLRRRPGLIGSGALFRHHWHLLFRTRAEMAYWVAYTVMQAADQTLSRQLYLPFQR
ncbi:ubiquitin-specific protease ubp2 [Verticillium nonalfalfae]|uniref:Ubiquitin-specific protease ubp2 n=1 Tax=Verticillium nonalfalfae TaxID=1051616 RepID=A0A3M9YEB4_9PEZI|nr:ubiquitin-specific protease ubp2 [Verticillium nonalfalfae]RNJ58877.1 ubiquitin-specific protease ubp2 [Verticillium nonalfalfae]